MGTFQQVWTGGAGLARTYWLFGVAGSFVWGMALGVVTPGSIIAMAAVALFLAYLVAVNVGIWRAASRYDGPKVWAVLAKVAVAALPVLIVVGTLLAVSVGGSPEVATGHQSPRYYTDAEVGFPVSR